MFFPFERCLSFPGACQFYDLDIEDVSKEEFKRKEREANDFAAAFLLPEETFRRDAERGPQTITYYKQLKKKWKVSIAAMILDVTVNYPLLETSPYQKLATEQLGGYGGAILSLRVGSKERAYRLMNHLKFAHIATNIGDLRTLVIHSILKFCV